MGLLDQTNGKSYLDYYRNYRGPSYNFEWAKQTTAPTATAAQALNSPGASQIIGGSGGDGDQSQSGSKENGYGWGGMQGSQADKGSAVNSSNLGMIGGLLGAGLGLATSGPMGALSGYNTGSKLGGMVGKGAESLDGSNARANARDSGLGEEGSTAMQHGASVYGLSPVAVAMAAMDAQASENDANRGGYSAFSDSQSLADAIASGNWGGSADADSYGGGSLSDSVSSGDWGGSADSDGWKNGGMIKNRRGLLDGEETSDAKTFKGLLSGPITKERDNIPAVNKTTGEKIAVESGEFVMTRKAVQKKGAKFFEKINKDAEKGK